MNRLVAPVLIALSLNSVLVAQDQRVQRPALERAIAGLKDPDWEEHGIVLIHSGARGAALLGVALGQAVDDGDKKLVDRILRTLDRMGLAASDASDAVWKVMLKMEPTQIAACFHAALQTHPLGDNSGMKRILAAFQAFARMGAVESHGKNLIDLANSNNGFFSRRSKLDPAMDVRALLQHLAKDDEYGEDALCQVLGARGKAARAAIPALERLLRIARAPKRKSFRARRPRRPGRQNVWTPNPRFLTGMRASDAILKISPRSAAAARAHAFRLRNEPFRALKLRSARELTTMVPFLPEVAPQIIAFLASPGEDHELTRQVLQCAALAGIAAKAAIPHVEKIASCRDRETALHARSVLKRLRAAR